MQQSSPAWRLSFQTKVLLPVILILILLVGIMIGTLNQRITNQLQTEAAHELATANSVFQNSQIIRAKNLLLLYRNVPNDPRFKAVSQKGDADTLRFLLAELIDELGGDIALSVNAEGQRLAEASKDSRLKLSDFESHSAASIKAALEGQPNVDTIQVGQRLFDVVSIPVSVGNNIVGALTFGTEIGQPVAQEFKQLTRSEIAFLVSKRVAISTLDQQDLDDKLAGRFNQAPKSSSRAVPPRKDRVQPITIGNEHFLGLSGHFPSLNAEDQFGYLLLSSYEQPLRVLHATQRLLGGLSLLGILLSTGIVWVLIRKATQPLRELRDSAEAVGRGDFSHRVAVRSRDECGELASAFNQMTENVKTSREDLEKAVERLKTTQAQLIQSEKLSAIGEFVAGVTHELNNPLTSVIGFAELLQQSQVSEKQRRFLDLIMNSAQRCHKIVQSLLSFARQHKPERKPVKLHELMVAAVDILQYQMRTSNIQVVTEFDPCLPKVMADPHQIQQVFLNIINNARQAIEGYRPKGLVRIRTETGDGRVRVLFKDDGPGISPENLAKIFNPFFTTKEVGKGTGLGLSLTFGIIQEHGGTVRAESTLGEGATFIIDLPALSPDQNGATTFIARAAPTALKSHGKKILVVDDEDSILSLIQEALAAQGALLDVARDGETALRHLRQNQYDVTVCDWKMPGLNGQQVFEQVQSFDPAAAARFIFITGDVINEKMQQFLQKQGASCLVKPFSMDDFHAAVGKILNPS